MLRFIAPAGAPLGIGVVLRAVQEAIFCNTSEDDQLRILASRLRVRSLFAASSGRAALCVILRSLRRLQPECDIVAAPAYTCFSVAASVVRAGLRLHPIDVNPESLDLDFSQIPALPPRRVLCILSCSLFGLVNDVARAREMAHAQGVFLVDDAAQAFGAWRGEQAAGAMGDAGFYSCGRGKALSTGEGGYIVTDNEEVAGAIRRETEALPPPSIAHSIRVLMTTVAYALFLRPRLYWLPNSVPVLKLGTTEFEPKFGMSRVPSFARALLTRLVDQLDGINQIRRTNAEELARGISHLAGFTTPRTAPGSRPIYIRFPVIAPDEKVRDRAVQRLRAVGIGASPFYPTAICDIPGIQPHMATQEFHQPRAEELSRRLLTLPTHPFVRPRDLERMIEILRTC